MIVSESFDFPTVEKKQNCSTFLDAAQVELWFQPSYSLYQQTTIHQEVLLRWRDTQQQLRLPQDFLAQVDEAGMTRQLDRLVLSQAIEVLRTQPDVSLSVNLFKDAIYDSRLTQDLRDTLDQAGVNPQRLSIELTENAIAQDFAASLALVQHLKAIGMCVILDDFVGTHLSSDQCKQLPIDWVKVNGELIRDFSHNFAAQALIQAIFVASHELGAAIAKSVTDHSALQAVQGMGFAYAQGNYFKPPSPTPVLSSSQHSPIQLPASSETPPTIVRASPHLWKRTGMALTTLGLGATVCIVAAAAASYRLGNLVTNGGQINGRVTRLQAPIAGKLKEFYAQPGALVQSGQVLARITPSPQDEQNLLLLEGEIRANEAQLAAARNSLVAFQSQLNALGTQGQGVRTIDVSLAENAVAQRRDAIAALTNKAQAAQLEYERYRQLAAEGAITRQKADELRYVWRSAQAEVTQAKTAMIADQASLQASQAGIANSQTTATATLADQRTKLTQTIQEQLVVISRLESKIESDRQRLKQARSLYGRQQDAEVRAPLTGVVYTTQQDRGGQVSPTEPLISVLDCNTLWAETVLPASQASNLDPQQPVQVQLVGVPEQITGQVTLVQPIGDRLAQANAERGNGQTEALPPVVLPTLAGQPLVRVVVKIPPTPQYSQVQRFCGLGQSVQMTFAKKTIGF